MLRKSVVVFSVLCIAATGAFMIGCGSSSTTPAKCTGTFTVVGDWQGTLSGGGVSDPLFGTIDASGNATFFDSSADMLVLPGITGACSFSETLTAYESLENPPAGVTTVTATGNVTSDSAITGSAVSNGQTTSFNLGSYAPEATLSAPSGTLTAVIEGTVLAESVPLTFSGTTTSMTFTGTDANNCTFSGTFTEEAVSNVYDVTFAVSGASCNAVSYTGSGFESSADILGVGGGATGAYLYGMMNSATTAFVFEVIPPGVDAARRVHVRANQTGFGKLFGFRHVTR